jgi:O-antigen ligase
MAHLAVICVPALVLAAVTARRAWGALAAAAGAAVIAAALVLSRSRAAYLGLGAGLAVLAYGLWRARGRWGAQPYSPRLKALALAAVLGALAALLLPNTLAWRSGSPYLDTVTGMVNYRKGSGHGRIVQYTRTLRLAAQHPVLGVGTGNWAVVYPKLAAHYDHDPSINYFRGTTLNPWPSSDWVAVASERGLPALAVLLLVFLGLLLGAWRKTARAADRDEYFEGVALAAALAATATVACFDAVLLLPAPAFIAWALFGALAAAAPHKFTLNLTPRLRGRLLAAVALVGAAAVLRSAGQVAAMGVFSKARTLAQFGAAARLDPGNARIRERYAALLERRNQAPAAAPEPELLPAATTEMELPVQTDDDEVSTSTAAPETD